MKQTQYNCRYDFHNVDESKVKEDLSKTAYRSIMKSDLSALRNEEWIVYEVPVYCVDCYPEVELTRQIRQLESERDLLNVCRLRKQKPDQCHGLTFEEILKKYGR